MQRSRHFHTNPFKRVLAFLIDFLPIQLAAVFICKEFYNITPFPEFDPTVPLAEQAASLHAFGVMMAAVLSLWILYGILAEASPMRATFGKRLLRLYVCNLLGAPLSFSKTLLRNFAKILSLVPFGFGFLWSIFAFNNRTWHDFLAKAIVVENRN